VGLFVIDERGGNRELCIGASLSTLFTILLCFGDGAENGEGIIKHAVLMYCFAMSGLPMLLLGRATLDLSIRGRGMLV